MKIVHIFWSLSFGGIETMLINIVNEQVKLGAKVTVIIINDLYDDALVSGFNTDVELICLGRKIGGRNLDFIFRLNEIIGKSCPDAIHLHDTKIFGLISRKLSRGASVTLHDLPAGPVRRGGLLRKLFPVLNTNTRGNVLYIDKIPRVFAISQAVHDELKEKYGVESIVINNGIRTSIFEERKKGLFDEPLKVIQVSRLQHDKKGQDLLIRAIGMLGEGVTVDFIGEGESMDYLVRLADELGVSHRVHFLGKQTQGYITKHLCEYDLFVQPSRYEGFGLTVAEAMAAHVPVLVSAGQGPAEVTCNDRYGWVFENGNVDDLVAQIKSIKEHYAEAVNKAAEARQYVLNTYDVSVTARKYMESYI